MTRSIWPWLQGIANRTIEELKTHFVVKWWDPLTNRQTSRWLKKSDPLSVSAAAQLVQSKESVADDVRITLTIKQVAQDLRRMKFFFRIPTVIQQHHSQEVPLDAYVLSTWLGDGTAAKTNITNIDEHVLNAWRLWAEQHDMQFHQHQNTGRPKPLWPWAISNKPYMKDGVSRIETSKPNPMRQALRLLGVFHIKRIPETYKFNTVQVRMETLAGLIDTDGHLANKTSYEFVQSLDHEPLFDDFREVAISLGFRMSKTFVTKTCTHNGVKKEFPAVRGFLYGDARLADIPVRIPYKKIVKEKLVRHDLYKFDVKAVDE